MLVIAKSPAPIAKPAKCSGGVSMITPKEEYLVRCAGGACPFQVPAATSAVLCSQKNKSPGE